MKKNTSFKPVSLWRILGSMVYDGVLLFACYLIGNLLITPLYDYLQTSNHPISNETQVQITMFICFLLTGIYFLVQYKKGGQTVGQRAWQFKVANYQGHTAQFSQYFVRYLWSWMLPFILYLGLSHVSNQAGSNYQALIILAPCTNLIYCFFNPYHQTLHGKLSQTFFFSLEK